MKRLLLALILAASSASAAELSCLSPDGRLKVGFACDATGLRWTLARDGRELIAPSPLGLVFSGFKTKEPGELGELPRASRALLISLAAVWVAMGVYVGASRLKNRRKKDAVS